MRTIFIVDDNQTNLLMAKEVLDGTYRALALPSAEKMFDIIKKIMPDLILLDMEMPGMDGYTALIKLKENPMTNHIPVIFLTSYSNEALETMTLNAGAVDFITKPFIPAVLLNRIRLQIEIIELKTMLSTISQRLLVGNVKEAVILANEYRKR
ncbi:MAG: response regulator [Lachnospiraceae bacterium]|nr:response regulator [Lachnospiraceae bacterium]